MWVAVVQSAIAAGMFVLAVAIDSWMLAGGAMLHSALSGVAWESYKNSQAKALKQAMAERTICILAKPELKQDIDTIFTN